MEPFFNGWLSRHEQLLEDLLSSPRDDPAVLKSLIDRAFVHYNEYYRQKARLAARDVLLIFCPSWMNVCERTFLWITGFKPSVAFCLLRMLGNRVEGYFTQEQEDVIEELKRETGEVERGLSEEMARVQEAMAMPQVLGHIRGVRNGEIRAEAVETVMRNMEVLATSADAFRGRTVSRLVEILRPEQTVDFLAAAAQLHLRIRSWGSGHAAATG